MRLAYSVLGACIGIFFGMVVSAYAEIDGDWLIIALGVVGAVVGVFIALFLNYKLRGRPFLSRQEIEPLLGSVDNDLRGAVPIDKMRYRIVNQLRAIMERYSGGN
jgi:hypothetical protein